MSKNKTRDGRLSNVAGLAGGVGGRLASQPHARASDAMAKGMGLFRSAVKPRVGNDQLQGNLFEFIEAAKFNVDAELKRSSLKAIVTAAEGRGTDPVDIEIIRGGSVVKEVQAKSLGTPSEAAFELTTPKYRGMQKLVPKGQESKVRELAEKRANTGTLKAEDYVDTAQNVTGRLNHDGVASQGTSRAEADWATANPRLYATLMEAGQVTKEMGVTALKAGGAAMVIGGAMSIIRNGLAYRQGVVSGEEARENIIVDATRSGAKGAATGALSTGIRFGATKLKVAALQGAALPTVLAASMIDVGVSVYQWGKGEISADELAEKVGETGVCSTTSFWVGASAGIAFGPAGAIVGSLAGYIIASQLYESTLSILKGARLAREEAERIIQLCDEACAEMAKQRQEFEAWLDENIKAYAAKFSTCLDAVDVALAQGRLDETLEATAGLAHLFGQELLFKSQEEFDDFMLDSSRTLML